MSRMPCFNESNASVLRRKSASPKSVGTTPRGLRSTSRTPTTASRSARDCEIAGCVTDR
jgi:hypothetical protein